MNKHSNIYLFILLLCTGTIISSCNNAVVSPDNVPAEITNKTADDILTEITNNVIVSTYADLNAKAKLLVVAVTDLEKSQTKENLDKAQQAWVAAREPWELSEAFLFGPVDTSGLDPKLDSWPVNQVDLKNVLDNSAALTLPYIEGLEGTLKGFHTIEFLLWGTGEKTFDNFTPRELEYLVSLTTVLSTDTGKLLSAWDSKGENFAEKIIDAGKSGNRHYISQKSALEELAQGIFHIADEVGNGKINNPLEQEDVTLEESQYSHTSKANFSDNIRGIKNVYLGTNENGLNLIADGNNKTLDTKIRTEIEAAITAIEAIPGTFTAAIPRSSSARAAAENAREEVRKLRLTLEQELIPLISNLRIVL